MSPGHDRVVTIKSWNFSIAKIWCCMGFYHQGLWSGITFIYHYSLGSIHLELLSCWVESTHPFAARDVFWNYVWRSGIEPVDTNPVTGCEQVCLTSMIWRELVSHTSHPIKFIFSVLLIYTGTYNCRFTHQIQNIVRYTTVPWKHLYG